MKIFVEKKSQGGFFLMVRAEGQGIIGDAFGELERGSDETFFGLTYSQVRKAFNSDGFEGFIELKEK